MRRPHDMVGTDETSAGCTARPVGEPHDGPEVGSSPGRGMRAVAWLVAAWCAGFAVVNIAFEATGHFDTGPGSEYAVGLSMMDGLVVALKLLGAAVALASTGAIRPPVPPRRLAVLVWGAAALLGIYTLGSVVEAIGILAGALGSTDQITLRSVVYLGAFLVGAIGYGLLAVSYSRRHLTGRQPIWLGVLGAPLLLGLLLVAVPSLLVFLGVMPAYH